MSLPSKSMRSVRALRVPCPRRSHGPLNNGKDLYASLSLSCDDSWYKVGSGHQHSVHFRCPARLPQGRAVGAKREPSSYSPGSEITVLTILDTGRQRVQDAHTIWSFVR